jgi:hypothetical protein
MDQYQALITKDYYQVRSSYINFPERNNFFYETAPVVFYKRIKVHRSYLN